MYVNCRFENAGKIGTDIPLAGQYRQAEYLLFSVLNSVFHTIAVTFNEDGFRVMEKAVEQSWGQGWIVIEYLRPVFECSVWGDNHWASFVAVADHLKKEIGAGFVYG